MADTDPVVLFDFDGVFCDSTRECYTIALGARALIDGTPSSHELALEMESGDPLLGFFRSHRAYVRWPREYWLLLETFRTGGGAVTLTQRDFDEFEETGDPVALEFQEAFFDVRDEFRTNRYDSWIDLFDAYSSVVEGGREVMERLPFRILTGRDSSSVGAFLTKHGLAVPGEWIYDARRFRNKVEGFEAIRVEMGRDRPYAFLDDNVTQAALRLLMRVDRELDFKDEKIHETALFALDSLIKAQYPNGAWPQRFRGPPDPAEFPVKPASYPESWSRTWPGPDYRGHYTFNDNSNSDMIDAMLEASRIYDEPRYQAVAEKGANFILLAQMPDPQPGWAQQYDRDMHPAWARIFEPPSVTGGESQGVLKTLLLLYRETGDKKYIEPIPRALDYYRKSELPEVENPSAYRARACPAGSVCMARFYELKTNRPLYITKGTRARVRGESTNLLSGYGVSYSDESVIRHYGVLTRGDEFAAIAREYERVSHADPSALRRPDRLEGLSPWDVDLPSEPEPSLEDLARRASQAINTLDERGAWVEEGSVGKAERIVQLFAAEDMVVTVGDRTLSLPENETLEVFPGAKPPLEQIINSTTFANNVEALADYLASTAQ